MATYSVASSPTFAHFGNQSAVAQVQHDVISTRTRHLDLHYHHLRDLVKRYNLAVKWISTKDQVADALTKPMDRNSMAKFINQLDGLAVSKGVEVLEL